MLDRRRREILAGRRASTKSFFRVPESTRTCADRRSGSRLVHDGEVAAIGLRATK